MPPPTNGSWCGFTSTCASHSSSDSRDLIFLLGLLHVVVNGPFHLLKHSFVETGWTSVREPIEDDEERLTMKTSDMPPPLPRRVSNPKIQDDQALNEMFGTRTICTGATSEDAYK